MELLLLLPLSWLICWDFRCRKVLLWHLLLFGVMQVGVCIYRYGVTLTGWHALINTAILLIIGAGVWTYSFFRFKGKKKPIGMGDILFILLLTPCFDYRPFLHFLILSFGLTLIVWVTWHYAMQRESKYIPLISGVGICYSLLLIYQFITVP